MTRPNDIPADVWEAATLAADFIETEITDLVDWDSRAGITMMVAVVILAERERCAKIADVAASKRVGETLPEIGFSAAVYAGLDKATAQRAKQIAVAIRKGGA